MLGTKLEDTRVFQEAQEEKVYLDDEAISLTDCQPRLD
jgi:predicted nucleic acid-binding protein